MITVVRSILLFNYVCLWFSALVVSRFIIVLAIVTNVNVGPTLRALFATTDWDQNFKFCIA